MNVAILGAGIMGSGIAQVAASSGYTVSVLDVGNVELERAQAAIKTSLTRLKRKGVQTDADADSTLSRLRFTTDLNDATSEAEILIEAAPEDLKLKQNLMAQAAEAAPPHCLLGTNTSQLSITAIGSLLGHSAERLVGMHFFNPPVLMRLVELMGANETSQETLKRAQDFAQSLGKETVLCHKDVPGFITTRCSVILRLECMRMLEEGVGSAEEIDKALRLGLNHPMGPLELGDLVGLDTFLQSSEGLAKAHGERFSPPSIVRKLVRNGRFGRKTSHGIYKYNSEGRRTES